MCRSTQYTTESRYYYYLHTRAAERIAPPSVGGAVLIYVCAHLVLLTILGRSTLVNDSMPEYGERQLGASHVCPFLLHYLPHSYRILTLIKWRGLLRGSSQR